MPISDTLWNIEPHTVGKHELLRGYLPAWLNILGSWHGDLVLFDGFAGPGKYVGGEEGSPLIMLREAENYASKKPGTSVNCVFVENDPDRFEHLRKLVDGSDLPDRVKRQVLLGDFADRVAGTLHSIAQHQSDVRPVPSFFMIDPFGIKGVPFNVFRGLLGLDKSECLFTFMWEAIQRFSQLPEFEQHMLELFGNYGWRGLESDELKEYVYSRFEQRLRDAGAKYVLVFDLWEEGRHVYSLFFATKGIKGCDVMKQVIWKLDPTGSYSFRGTNPWQSQLDMVFAPGGLGDDLRGEFGTDWVYVEQAVEFVMGDSTRYHSGQLKKHTLVPLEKQGVIEVKRLPSARSWSFIDGVQFRFAPELVMEGQGESLELIAPEQGSLF